MPQLTKSIPSSNKGVIPWDAVPKSISTSQSAVITSSSSPWYKSLEMNLPREVLLLLLRNINIERGWIEGDYFGNVSLTREIVTTLEELKNVGISIQKQEEIYNYLLLYPDMISTTIDIAKIAPKCLSDAKLFLEVYSDPESEDNHLVLYARFRFYNEFTIEKIKSVRKEYRHLLVNKSGWLLLTTDFKTY